MGCFVRSTGGKRSRRDGSHQGARMREVGEKPVYFEHLSPAHFKGNREFEVVPMEEAEEAIARSEIVVAKDAAIAAGADLGGRLQARVAELEGALAEADEAIKAREGTIANLRREVAEVEETREALQARVDELEATVEALAPDVPGKDAEETPATRVAKQSGRKSRANG